MTALRRAVLAAGAVLVAACVPSGPATIASDAQKDVSTPVEAYDDSDLRARLGAMEAEIDSTSSTTKAIRKRLTRTERRLADLEQALAANAADSSRIGEIEAATRLLSEGVQLLRADVDQLAGQASASSSRQAFDSAACVVEGGEWSPVLEACLK